MNIKNEFRIDTLMAILPFIKMVDNSIIGGGHDVHRIIDYADILETTPITEDLFTGDKAIFEGWEVDFTVSNGTGFAIISKELGLRFLVCKDEMEIKFYPYIKSLFDLAELTKDNPLKLK